MTIETATYISDLNSTLPGASDLKAEGDDHIRLVKSTVKATFPNVTGAVTATHTQLNSLIGGSFPNLSTGNLTTTGNTILGDASTDTLNVGNGGIIKDATGKVGFGAAPTYAVHLTASGSTGILAATSSDASGATVFLQANSNIDTRTGSIGALPFLILTNSIERMRVDAAGNVGIGKSPTTTLDVNGQVKATSFSGALSGNISQFTNDAGFITSAGAAAAGSLTGATLAANVLNSSLTTVGNLSALTVTGTIVGSITGNAGTATSAASVSNSTSNGYGTRTVQSGGVASGGADGDITYIY